MPGKVIFALDAAINLSDALGLGAVSFEDALGAFIVEEPLSPVKLDLQKTLEDGLGDTLGFERKAARSLMLKGSSF